MRKIIIAVIAIGALLIFYQKFITPTMSEFFNSYKSGVDFHGKSSLDIRP